jgi:hypothetical protein
MSRFASTKRVFVPGPPKFAVPDKQDIQTMEKLAADKQVEIFLNRTDCEDYVLNKTTGVLEYPLKSINFNGFHLHLKPGKNIVPESVKDFIDQCEQAKMDGQEYNQRMSGPKSAPVRIL